MAGGSGKTIDIDVDAFLQSKTALEESLSMFRSYSSDFIDDIITLLSPFNSDFVTQITKTLNNMKDTKAPELVAALEDYKEQLRSVAEDFPAFDENIADEISGGGGKSAVHKS